MTLLRLGHETGQNLPVGAWGTIAGQRKVAGAINQGDEGSTTITRDH